MTAGGIGKALERLPMGKVIVRAAGLAYRAVRVLLRDGPVVFGKKALRYVLRRNPLPTVTSADVEYIAKSGVFDEPYYVAQHRDAKAALDPIRHYLEKGWLLGLNPHALFDTNYYLKNNKDVAKDRVNPLLHYLRWGGFEGRKPSPQFDSAHYLATYRDVARAGVNPLEHYIGWGEKEGRAPNSTVYMPGDPGSYRNWLTTYHELSAADRAQIAKRIAGFARLPRFSVLIPVYNTPEPWLRAAVESVRRQIYPHWELCLADDGSTAPHVAGLLAELAAQDPRIKVVRRPKNGGISAATNSALALAQGDFVALVDHDDEVSGEALYLFAEELNLHPDADLLYSDEDKLDGEGQRFDPFFKPDWDPELILAENFVSHLLVVRTSLMRDVGGLVSGFDGAQDHDLVLRLSERTQPGRIRHLPFVLYHWRQTPESTATSVKAKPEAGKRALKAVQQHLQRRGVGAQVVQGKTAQRTRVIYDLPQPPPLVTAIVPTKDHTHLLQALMKTLLKETDYPNLEVVLVSNNTSNPEALAYLDKITKDPRVRLLKYPHPYNFPAINNLGVRNARGTVVALINDDIEGTHADWLKEMVRFALRPDVGIVGCKLYYPDGKIQHAGVILGIGGVAGHLHKFMSHHWPGRMGDRAIVAQTLSAVTAACVVMRKEVYEAAGGLDEDIPNSFNDVDLCIRVRDRGFRNVFTPFAELVHKESATRGGNETPEKQTLFEHESKLLMSRYGDALKHDPYYNPNLSLRTEDEALAIPPRSTKPWLTTLT